MPATRLAATAAGITTMRGRRAILRVLFLTQPTPYLFLTQPTLYLRVGFRALTVPSLPYPVGAVGLRDLLTLSSSDLSVYTGKERYVLNAYVW
jgi:hypothetical protein